MLSREHTVISEIKNQIMPTSIVPTCQLCGRTFTRKSSLTSHTMIHEGIKPFNCVTCGKDFRKKNDLEKHRLIHQGIRRHHCQFCIKFYICRSYFKRHWRMKYPGLLMEDINNCITIENFKYSKLNSIFQTCMLYSFVLGNHSLKFDYIYYILNTVFSIYLMRV